MRQAISVAAAALLTTLPAAIAGKARVYNHCDFTVYSWSVDADNNPSSATPITSGGGCYEEDFRKPVSGGVSIKLAPEDNLWGSPITQLEYTINYDTWYDVSNVDCTGTACPFQKHGLYLESGPGCPTVACQPGNLTCHGAYTLWDDNWASLCCTEPDTDVTLHLCRDSPGGSSPPVVAAPPPAKKPKVHAPVTTPTPTPADPYTSVVPFTEYATVVVTVSPDDATDSYQRERRKRHVHNHMDAHNRFH